LFPDLNEDHFGIRSVLGTFLGKGQQSFFYQKSNFFEEEELKLCCLTQIMRLDLYNSNVYTKKE